MERDKDFSERCEKLWKEILKLKNVEDSFIVWMAVVMQILAASIKNGKTDIEEVTSLLRSIVRQYGKK